VLADLLVDVVLPWRHERSHAVVAVQEPLPGLPLDHTTAAAGTLTRGSGWGKTDKTNSLVNASSGSSQDNTQGVARQVEVKTGSLLLEVHSGRATLVLPFARFHRGLSQLADQWLDACDPRAYAAFLYELYHCTTKPVVFSTGNTPRSQSRILRRTACALEPLPEPSVGVTGITEGSQSSRTPALKEKQSSMFHKPSTRRRRRKHRNAINAQGPRYMQAVETRAKPKPLTIASAPEFDKFSAGTDAWRTRYLRTGGNLAASELLARFLAVPIRRHNVMKQMEYVCKWAGARFWFTHPLDPYFSNSAPISASRKLPSGQSQGTSAATQVSDGSLLKTEGQLRGPELLLPSRGEGASIEIEQRVQKWCKYVYDISSV